MAVQFRAGFVLTPGSYSSPQTATEPTGTTNTDLMVALCLLDGATPSPPTGWTTLYSNVQGAMNWNVAYIQRGASAPSMDWTWSGTHYAEIYIVTARSDSAGTVALHAQSSAGSQGSGTNIVIDPPSAVASVSNTLAVCGGAWWVGATTGGYTAPTGYDGIVAYTGVGAGGFLSYNVLASAGTEDPGTVGNSLTGTDVYWHGFTVILSDSGGGGGYSMAWMVA